MYLLSCCDNYLHIRAIDPPLLLPNHHVVVCPCTINPASSVHAKKLGKSTSVNVRGRSLLPSHFRRSRSLLVGGAEWKGVDRRLFIYCKLRTRFKKPKDHGGASESRGNEERGVLAL